MGSPGYQRLLKERKENFKYINAPFPAYLKASHYKNIFPCRLLKEKLQEVAEKHGEKVLETKNNPISIGTLTTHVDLPHFFTFKK